MITKTVAGFLIFLSMSGCKSATPETLSAKDIYEPNWTDDTCPTHHIKLIEAVEPLDVGKMDYDGEYYDARKTFPYAMTKMNTDAPPYYWRARYCTACREGLEAWEQKRNREP